MVEVTVLPPQVSFPQLTAKHVIKTLGEHRTAFMNANNLSGYVDDDYVLREDKVADLLTMIGCTKGMTWQQVKDFGWKIKQLTKDSKSKLSLVACIDLVSKALGYNGQALAQVCQNREGFVENLWGEGIVVDMKMFEQDGKIRADKGAFLRVYQNRTYNLALSRHIKESRKSESEVERIRAKKDLQALTKKRRTAPIEFR